MLRAALMSGSRPGLRLTATLPRMDQSDGQPGFVIDTDGACEENPGGPGGWGFQVRQDGQVITEDCGGTAAPTTSNRMELMAAIMALESVPAPASITLRSDSRYVTGNARQLRKWKRNGWKTSARNGHQPVKNRQLWERLDRAISRHHRVEWEHVRGHAGDPGNERADELAALGLEKAVFDSPESRAGSAFTWLGDLRGPQAPAS